MNIPFTSAIQHITDIEERNAAFTILSNEEKRREIAYESLMLVVNKVATAAQNYSHYWSGNLHDELRSSNTPRELQRRLLKVEACSVCQRGLIMLAQIRIGNNVDPYMDGISKGSNALVLRGFDQLDMDRMEYSFECENEHNTSRKQASICCNIIANGNFIGDDKTDYVKLWNLEDKLS